MKPRLLLNVLLFVSILVFTVPTMAVAPVRSGPPVPTPDQGLDDGTVHLELEVQPAPDLPITDAQHIMSDVSMSLDDGSPDVFIGNGGERELLYLNRFTPAPGDFPFQLDQIHVAFANAYDVQVGDDIMLVVYKNTSGHVDPANGSELLATLSAEVYAVDSWNVYGFITPPVLYGPGDVLIGVIALEKPGSGYLPAALDTNDPKGRSWLGWWSASPPPDPPLLPPTDTWDQIGDLTEGLFDGNWLIRAYGTHMPGGGLEGYVTDANIFVPLDHANLYLTGVTDPDLEELAWTNASGYYTFGALPEGEYELRTSAYGYQTSQAPATVVAGFTTQQDFELDAAVPMLSPKGAEITLPPNASGSTWVTLENDGSGVLMFHVSEVPNEAPFDAGPGIQEMPQGGLPTGIAPEVYADLEASPDGTGRYIVYLEEQADLSAAFGIKDWSARGQYVFDTLRSVAERTQASLRTELQGAGVGFESRYIVNALVVEGTIGLAEEIVTRPGVAGIGPNGKIEAPAPVVASAIEVTPDPVEWNIRQVHADDVWTGIGVDGSGIVVASIDTGVQWDHPALVNAYRGSPVDHDYHWWDPYGHATDAPADPHGHGTHTMGTMVGDDGSSNQIGMAPGATWFACNGFESGYGYEAELLECAEFLLAPWDLSGLNPDPALRADVVNNSWGGVQSQWWFNQAVYAWRAAGIFPVTSAGNEGYSCETVGDPGDMANVLTVGATDASDSNAPGSLAAFSSRGPAPVTGFTKPNVTAPGANIRSSVPGDGYSIMQGTSMAAPHVAGEVALIWSAMEPLRGDVRITQWIIEQSAYELAVDQGYLCGGDLYTSHPNNQYGWGRIDAYQAVVLALSNPWDMEWLSVDPAAGEVPAGGSQDIELVFDTTGKGWADCYYGKLKFEYNDPYVTEEDILVELCVGWRIHLPLVLNNE